MTEQTRHQKYKASYLRYYQANRERFLQWNREWRRTHKEHIGQYGKQWRQEHPDYSRLKHRNPEVERKARRKWRKNNPEKVRAEQLLYSNPTKYPLNDECDFCGATGKLEHGHIDYAFPELYLTVCHPCNYWMDRPVDPRGWARQ